MNGVGDGVLSLQIVNAHEAVAGGPRGVVVGARWSVCGKIGTGRSVQELTTGQYLCISAAEEAEAERLKEGNFRSVRKVRR